LIFRYFLTRCKVQDLMKASAGRSSQKPIDLLHVLARSPGERSREKQEMRR
ncbi:hypothetical protein ABVT39_027094, partial [Epinephelus coioides]